MLKSVKKYRTNVGLILAIPNISNTNYFNKVLDTIIEYNLQDNILIVTDNAEIWPLYKHSNLFIRPTYTDGDSLSIREAIYFNVPVVASDCAIRPNSVMLYNNQDLNDFILKCFISLNIPIDNYDC